MNIEYSLSPAKMMLNLSISELVTLTLERGEAELSANQALIVNTGKRTARSPRDRFIVRDNITTATVAWGEINQALDQECFTQLWAKAISYLKHKPDYFMANLQVGADAQYGVQVKVITEYAWHSLFARLLFISPINLLGSVEQLAAKEWTLLSVPGLTLDAQRDGVNSDAAIIINFAQRCILICGTHYAGEMKKAMFSVLNFLLPPEQVLPMHCAANVGQDGNVALFFGLSGTGKTTLSSDPARLLIGDDEHGWSEQGVFNFEGGCYAKCINLSQENEPLIWHAIRYGSILENVVIDQVSKEPIYADGSITQNTRAAYPREYIAQHHGNNYGPIPTAVIFLTCDLYGVLPPVARLTQYQAAYYFLSGYTAMVGSTELGHGSEIKPIFSTCFGAPFFPRPAPEYAELLLARLTKYDTQVYLVNTGWTRGPYGQGGERFAIPTTRHIVTAIVSNQLINMPYENMPVFNFAIPQEIPGLDGIGVNPRDNWRSELNFDAQVKVLATKFSNNFAAKFPEVAAKIKQAGPIIA